MWQLSGTQRIMRPSITNVNRQLEIEATVQLAHMPCTTATVSRAYVINLVGHAIITFRVSRRRREMYCGHARLCLSVCPRPHAHTIARTRM